MAALGGRHPPPSQILKARSRIGYHAGQCVWLKARGWVWRCACYPSGCGDHMTVLLANPQSGCRPVNRPLRLAFKYSGLKLYFPKSHNEPLVML